jgi:chemotaxis protein methyltransferase CheR
MRIWSRFAELLPVGGHLYIGHSERVSGDAKAAFDNTGITTYRYNGKPGGKV